MKEYLRQLVGGARTSLDGRHVVLEYLQARVLAAMQQAGAFDVLAFHGGTALRFLYQIPRYSEDLDFALEREPNRYEFRRYLREVQRQLGAETYAIDVRVKDDRVVNVATIHFRGLLHELGLSPHPDEVLMVKVEVDTNPPAGAGLQTTVIRRHVLLNLLHHDRSSLLAGKLHALLQRDYVKGRDLYDLFWYLGNPDWPEPNLTMLNAALAQTGWQGDPLHADSWRAAVWQRLSEIRWEDAVRDVQPFLMNAAEVSLLTREGVKQFLAVG
jgi:hypothetical protein